MVKVLFRLEVIGCQGEEFPIFGPRIRSIPGHGLDFQAHQRNGLDVFQLLAIIAHFMYSPYTKVEKSFNSQPTHGILLYGISTGCG